MLAHQRNDTRQIAGAETRAFALWAERFGEQKRRAFQANWAGNQLLVLLAVFPMVVSLFVFAAANDVVAVPLFLAFYAALTLLLSANTQLVIAYLNLLAAVPAYERLRPILQALPEVDDSRPIPAI
ncbi:MAG: hypothetical protein H7175_26090 [Burkholderiales bacterium]|nr:hypothetical protein [Anaerolineae bacterium]